MPKLVVRPIEKGLRTDRLAFNIDNDSFPTLLNAYQWRGRIKRKRGTSLLGRLTRFFNSSSTAYSSVSTINLVSGSANILTGFSLQTNGNIVPGSVSITDTTASVTYTDPGKAGILVGSPSGSGTINYATGAITITAGGSDAISAQFLYYPDLPVMGLEELNLQANVFPGTLAFDTVYSYNIVVSSPYPIYDVSFYKNPPSSTYPGYTAKTTVTPTSWNGQDYQQFWTVNYQGALWATNGINVPFTTTNIGMQYKPIVSVTVTSGGPPAIVSLQITGHGLVIGDFLFINEVSTTTGINFQTGYVTTVTDANNVVVEFPNATISGSGTGGIAQYLTNRATPTKDCLRWYDGDPTNGNATTPTLNGGLGWVNFAPPLSQGTFGIEDEPPAQYYLVGARMIIPFKDRLLFLGPVIQTSTAGSQVYLQDTIIYSQNGTPYYTASFTSSNSGTYPKGPYSSYSSILVPTGQTGLPTAYFEDQTGFGGYITAGIAQPILTVNPNEDVLIVGFSNKQSRLTYTGNDILPFNFFSINSELGSASTFSSITLDRGAMAVGPNGIVLTTQTSAQRIDLPIPDQIFQFSLTSNGFSRVCAQRDFINEWIYFTYPDNEIPYIYPNQTLQYNYREDSWAIFNESYTTYGAFRRQTGQTWATLPASLTWNTWNTPWNSGDSTLLQPEVIGGNQQGFVLFRDSEGTGEGNSLYIQSFSGSTVTAPNHCLNNGDYIVISGCIGTISTQVNGKIFSVTQATTNTFGLDPPIGSGTYVGGGLIQRMYVPYIQTKQFPVAWEMARKTRLGPQQYLLTTTNNGQITLLIFLSQNAASPYNLPPIVPTVNSTNNSLIYSTILYTCPESTNLGLTPANINLQMVTGSDQHEIWHRMNTSLLGDTVQIGFTLSDAQMRDTTFSNQFAEIEIHGMILDVNPSQMLA
jgi:hypothetical protein